VIAAPPPFCDPARSFAERAADLLGRLTAEEKIAMLHQRSPAVPRLGMAEWWTGCEGVHGAAWRPSGAAATVPATVFPQPVGFAASWDPSLAERLGTAVGAEIRALHREFHGQPSLNVWAPVVNPLRDPRWGRNEEGYSEDPLLTSVIATAFCRGLAGVTAAGYLRTAPTLKHFLAYNNERHRDLTSSQVRPRVLHEYDLPPFRGPVEAGVATGVMPSYNLVNGRPAHVSPLLGLIREWTEGELLTCSDAFAPSNLAGTEHYFRDHAESHAAALKAGLDSFTDQDADGTFTVTAVRQALDKDLITMADVDRAVRRKLLIRLRLGEFDPGGGPYGGTGIIGHRNLAREAAIAGIVLLRNDDALLPIHQQRVAVIGPLADTVCEDWYSPALPYKVTIAAGLAAAVAGPVTVCEAADRVRTDLGEFDVFDWGGDVVTLRHAGTLRFLTVTGDGSLETGPARPHGWVTRETFRAFPQPGGDMILESVAAGQAFRLRWDVVTDGIAAARGLARDADVAVVVVGNDPLIGARETADRTTTELPPRMNELIRAVTAANPRTVLVIMSSYPYVTAPAPAILWTAHGGQETGSAVAGVLTGAVNPSGKLTQTWYRADEDLPDPLDYDIIKAGWTYQYSEASPLWPFGHGLSFTSFEYGPLTLSPGVASLTVRNTGDREGTEVVQLYARYPAPGQPRLRLCGFTRVTLAPGQTAPVRIELPDSALALWDVRASRFSLPPGEIVIGAGASSADIRATAALHLPAAASSRQPRIDAASFDDYENIALVDATLTAGDAVTPADLTRRSWLTYQDVPVSERRGLILHVACGGPGGGRIEVRSGHADGAVLGTAVVPATGGRYSWTDVTVPLSGDGPLDLCLALGGPVRLAWLGT
jgi:beta-glucosidase